MKKLLPLFIAFAFCATSCTLDKRHYRKGFYVSGWNKSSDVEVGKDVKENSTENEIASTVIQSETPVKPEVEGSVLHSQEAGLLDNDVVTEKSSDAIVVTQSNTTKDFVNKIDAKQTKAQAAKKRNSPDETGGNDKSQLVAFLLCFFFGVLGIHRFYLGYVGFGLLELFTLGGLGILWLIDLFLILFGVLKPKNGNYK